jgi:hypothetical protein
MDKYGWAIVMIILLGVGIAGTLLLLLSRKTTGTTTETSTPTPTPNMRKVTISAYANRLLFPDEGSSCDIVIKSGNTEIGTIHHDKLNYFNPANKTVNIADGDYTLVCYCPSKDYPKTVSYTNIHVASDMTVEVWADIPEPEGYVALTVEILNYSSGGYERPFEWEYKLDNILDDKGGEVPLYQGTTKLDREVPLYQGTTMLDRGVITALIPRGVNLKYIMIYRYDQEGNEADHLTIWTNIKANTDILARIVSPNSSPLPGKILYEVKVFDKGIPISVGADQISVYEGGTTILDNSAYSLDNYGEKGMVGVSKIADGNVGQIIDVFVKDKLNNTTYTHITESINSQVVYVLVDHTYKWR